jgi:hypothetical protein
MDLVDIFARNAAEFYGGRAAAKKVERNEDHGTTSSALYGLLPKASAPRRIERADVRIGGRMRAAFEA